MQPVPPIIIPTKTTYVPVGKKKKEEAENGENGETITINVNNKRIAVNIKDHSWSKSQKRSPEFDLVKKEIQSLSNMYANAQDKTNADVIKKWFYARDWDYVLQRVISMNMAEIGGINIVKILLRPPSFLGAGQSDRLKFEKQSNFFVTVDMDPKRTHSTQAIAEILKDNRIHCTSRNVDRCMRCTGGRYANDVHGPKIYVVDHTESNVMYHLFRVSEVGELIELWQVLDEQYSPCRYLAESIETHMVRIAEVIVGKPLSDEALRDMRYGADRTAISLSLKPIVDYFMGGVSSEKFVGEMRKQHPPEKK
jgi:hypothetical protein